MDVCTCKIRRFYVKQRPNELFDPLPVAPVLCTFVQYLIAFYSPPEAAGDIISGAA